MGDWTIHHGDCIPVMAAMPENSVDAVVCDPPYSIEFMGRAWDRHENEDAGMGYYLAGLIDGEGSFRVDAKARRCEFTMKMRDDDEWILRQAMAFIGHGRITRYSPRTGGSAPQATLVIDTKDGVAALCSLLMRYPLRAKKLRDFLTWAEAVDEWLTMERGSRWHGPADRIRLAELGRRIREGRTYSEIPWSGNGFQDWCRMWGAEALRVLRPGGHLLAFGGTRTSHRLTCGLEDAGFEIRDCLSWLYGSGLSGFPKSLDVSKAIDKAAGAEGTYGAPKSAAHAGWIDRGRMRGDEGHDGYQRPWMQDEAAVDRNARKYEPGSDAAQQWSGWGTALKPGHEPIVLARKPLTGTVAATVLEHGTGALNIDGCRIGTDPGYSYPNGAGGSTFSIGEGNDGTRTDPAESNPLGRWPANVILDPDTATILDEQTGELISGKMQPTHTTAGVDGRNAYGSDAAGGFTTMETYGDKGGASRFYYCAKTSSAERNAGLDDFEERDAAKLDGGEFRPDGRNVTSRENVQRNVHPTVKPIELMRWLTRLTTPPGGLILDPFTGSGSTGIAAILEGFRFVGIERESEYVNIARARLRWWDDHPHGMTLVRRLEHEAEAKAQNIAGQLALDWET